MAAWGSELLCLLDTDSEVLGGTPAVEGSPGCLAASPQLQGTWASLSKLSGGRGCSKPQSRSTRGGPLHLSLKSSKSGLLAVDLLCQAGQRIL